MPNHITILSSLDDAVDLFDACLCYSTAPWNQVHDLLRPGSHLLVVAASHRLTADVEDAGFEIRDCITVLTSQGSTSVLVAMKPIEGTYVENALKHGVAGLNIDGSRIGMSSTDNQILEAKSSKNAQEHNPHAVYGKWALALATKPHSAGRFPTNLILQHTPECICDGGYAKDDYEHGQKDVRPAFSGYAAEDGTETVDNWVCTPECPVRRLDEQTGALKSGARKGNHRSDDNNVALGLGLSGNASGSYTANSGGASRFFYNAKFSTSDEGTLSHDLFRYLAHLILPPDREGPRRLLTFTDHQPVIGGMLAGWDQIFTLCQKDLVDEAEDLYTSGLHFPAPGDSLG